MAKPGPKPGYKQTPEAKANQRAACNTPEARANNSAALLRYYQKHPGKHKEECNTPSAKANQRAANIKSHSTPEYKAIQSAANIKAQNTPEVLTLIQQYGSPLINKLRKKHYDLTSRCNDPNHPAYKYYGGRGIENRFTSQLDFLSYVINELHITTLEQIKGLDIDRIDNDGNYEPDNIQFVTRKLNLNNRRGYSKS